MKKPKRPRNPPKCVNCGCTDETPCTMPNGQPCAFAKFDPPICTRCAQENLMFGEQFTPLADDNNAAAFDGPVRKRA